MLTIPEHLIWPFVRVHLWITIYQRPLILFFLQLCYIILPSVILSSGGCCMQAKRCLLLFQNTWAHLFHKTIQFACRNFCSYGWCSSKMFVMSCPCLSIFVFGLLWWPCFFLLSVLSFPLYMLCVEVFLMGGGF